MIGQGGIGFKLKEGRFRVDVRKEFPTVWVWRHYNRLPMEAVDPIPGSAEDQIRWASEQPGLMECVPAHSRGVRTIRALKFLPTQTILVFS